MRKLFFALLLLLASVAASLWLQGRDGFVVLRAGEWTVQTSLIAFLGAVIVAWLLLWLLWGLLRGLWGTPRGVRSWLGRRRRRRARRETLGGLIQIADGRYVEAERQLMHRVRSADVPLMNYLLAALAAHRRGSWVTRDEYLACADQEDRRARTAVRLLQAQLQLEARQWEQSLATLAWLREHAPENRRALALLAKCAEAVKDWDRLAELLPELRRRDALPAEELNALERQVTEARLERAAVDHPERLDAVWQSLPRERRRDTEFVAMYVRWLMRAGRHQDAERMLRQQLSKDWDERLLALYAELETEPAEPVFRNTEKWLRERPEEPLLLYAAGRHALRSEVWGRARTYLEGAAARTGRPEVHRLLADLYDRLGETEKARRAYRRALGLDPGRSTLPPVQTMA